MSIKTVQEALSKRGYNPGVIDGLWGPRTESAMLAAIGAAPQKPSTGLTQRELDMHPELLKRWLKAKTEWNKQGNREVICTCSYRSPAEQDALYAQGRTRPGPIVTNARGGQSNHNYLPALAMDVGFLKPDKSLDWSEDLFEQFSEVFKPLGIEWGGDWTSFVDMPHFQAPGVDWRELQRGIEYIWD